MLEKDVSGDIKIESKAEGGTPMVDTSGCQGTEEVINLKAASGENTSLVEATSTINRATVEGICHIIGDLAAKVTKMDEMDFTDEEASLLADVWTPLMPAVSPMSSAFIATATILGGKFALYKMLKRKEKSNAVPAEVARNTDADKAAGESKDSRPES